MSAKTRHVKSCTRCERTFTERQWATLVFVGVQNVIADPDHPRKEPAYDLELRNCPCGTTLARERCGQANCEKPATKTKWRNAPICRGHLMKLRKIEKAKLPGAAGNQARNDLIREKFHKKWGRRRNKSGGRIEPKGVNRRNPAKLMLEYLERKLK